MADHYAFTTDMEALWKGFQEHNDLSDEEIEIFKNDPKRSHFVPKMADPDFQDWTMVVEVVSSHACSNGMKVGDKLYFKAAGGILDMERSCKNGWCAHAFNCISGYVNIIHNLLHAGVEDPNVFIYGPHFGCVDVGTEHGWGQVVMKVWCFRESLGEDFKDWANPTYID